MSRARWIATFAGALVTFAGVAALPALEAALPELAAAKARAAPPGPFGPLNVPAPLVSRGKRVVTSTSGGAALVDGVYRTGPKWSGGSPSATRPAWAAIEIRAGPDAPAPQLDVVREPRLLGPVLRRAGRLPARGLRGFDRRKGRHLAHGRGREGQPGARSRALVPVRRDELGADVRDAPPREGELLGALPRRD